MKEKTVWIDFPTIENFMIDVFKSFKISEENAKICADILISANKRGIDSHGIGRFKTMYYDQLKLGVQSTDVNIEIIKDGLTTTVVDGHGGMGHVIGKKSMEIAINKAKKYGLGMVAARNSTHYGFAGYYVLMAIKEGMIGITGTNTRPLVIPTFGIENILGTNPLTFGIPSDEEFPFVLDCATTVTAMGKIEQYATEGKKLPDGWVVNQQGQIVNNAKEALKDILDGKNSLVNLGGIGEEMGGYKGYGYATVVEILSAALQDGDYLKMLATKKDGKPADNHIGHFFVAINISSFIDLESFKKKTGDILRTLRSSKKAPGAEKIYTAGEKEHLMWLERKNKGVPINKNLQKQLLTIREELKLYQYQFPF